MKGYVGPIEKLTLENKNFRKVLFTGKYCQLVVMSLAPSEEIGMEVHSNVDQFFRIDKGTAKLVMEGEESNVGDGDAFIIPAGTEHNVVNTSSSEDLKLYTIYSPPNHPDETVHKTKKEAEEAEHKH